MLKYFMFASFLFILCFLQVSKTDATISCYVSSQNQKSQMDNVTGCAYCGYLEIENSKTTQNGIIRSCLMTDNIGYVDGPINITFTELNVCSTQIDNGQTAKRLICTTNNCNDKCVNAGMSLNFSIFAIFFSILIPLKFLA